MRDAPKNNTLFLLENEHCVKEALRLLHNFEGKCTLVALTPFAMHALEQRGLAYKIPEDYYTPEELFMVGKITHEKVERFCEIMDEAIHHELPELKAMNLRPAMYHIIPLIIVFDALVLRVFQIKKILEYERPNTVVAFSSKSYPYGAYGFCFDNRELLYGKLLELPGWNVQTTLLSTSSSEDLTGGNVGSGFNFKEKIIRLLIRNPDILHFVLSNMMVDVIRHHKLKDAAWITKKILFAKKNVMLFGALGYNVRCCYKTFLNQGIFLKYMDDKLYQWRPKEKLDSNALSKIIDRLDRGDFKKYFTYEGIDLYPLLGDRIKFLINEGVPACLAAFNEASSTIRKDEIKAVLTPFFLTPTAHSVAQAAKNLRVPTITWLHNPLIHKEALTSHYHDLMSSNVYLTYSTMLPARHLHHAERFGTKIVPVGSSRIEDIQKGAKNPKRKQVKHIIGRTNKNYTSLVYATTSYLQNNFYVAVYPPPSDNKLFMTQRSILDGIRKLDNINIIVKLFPGSCRDPPLIEHAKNIIWIKYKPSFVDLLSFCDVVVLDFPSTPLVEAIAAGKPVFLLTKHLEIEKNVLELLKRRVACFEKEEELLKSLKEYIQTGVYPADIDMSDKRFLKAYGTYLNDGKSCERAARAIIEAISTSTKKPH